MNNIKQAVILVGHGGLPKDIPQQVVESFMKINKQRIRSGAAITSQEKELESTIRNWERTPESDPYKTGLENLASYMEPNLDGYILKTAYNEFCYPSIETAVDELSQENISKIVIVTTMITAGGSHSEVEIPEELKELNSKYPDIDFQYAWSFGMDSFALFFTDHIKSFQPMPTANIN
jgi:sirohydrochlorin cobaltochelatase